MENNKELKFRYINFLNTIDEKQAGFLIQNCSDKFFMTESNTLYLSISSTGGSIDSGITLYNFLRSLPCNVFTHNIGTVDSAAILPYLAGDVTYASQFSKFLIHGIFWSPPGGQMFPLAQVNEFHSRLNHDSSRIRSILHERTSLSNEAIDRMFLSGETLSPVIAKEVGIISDIADLVIQPGSTVFTSNPA